MKIVILLSRFPYPLEKGDKLRAYHQLRELAKHHELILCALSDRKVEDAWRKELEKFCSEIHVFKLKKPLIYWNTAKQFFTDQPYQTGYFFQHWIKRQIHKLIAKHAPDHIYCQLIRTTEYVKDILHIPKTIDYMDALSKGMLRRAEISSGIRKKLFQVEGRRLATYENRIFDYFNYHTIISTQDRGFIGHPESDRITIVENGISEEFIAYEKKSDPIYDAVFVGNLNYPPNIACAEYIIEEIVPRMKKRNPNFRILISGANPSPALLAAAKIPEVTITGWVDDIRESYVQGKIFLAPLFIGTGLQNKLLEAMALGVPCITTPLANNALNAVPDESIKIASTLDQFEQAIMDLSENPVAYAAFQKAGKTFVTAQFNWAASVQKLEELFQKK